MGYSKLLTCLLTFFASLAVAQDRSIAQVKASFEKAHLPQDIHVAFNPSVLLEVTLPQATGPAVPVTAGVQLPRNQTVGPPQFAVTGDAGLELGQRFVVATVDPDAPTPQSPTSAQIRHFLSGDFVLTPGFPFEDRRLVNLTAPLSQWLQPTPPAGSDAHRYVFLLFRQPSGFDEQTVVTANTSISNFNISAFALETGLGDPIAGTFMLVAPDPQCQSGSLLLCSLCGVVSYLRFYQSDVNE
ncbi:PEBP-like protein [Cytidiella melzeri]|nr:PEBP-like protein [Cytidiella melzeri]